MTSYIGPVIIRPEFESVTDADEEIFILYSNLQATTSSSAVESSSSSPPFRGLGFVDSHQDTVSIQFEFESSDFQVVEPEPTLRRISGRSSKKKKTSRVGPGKTIEITLAQDKTALRSRKGDTGSVLWKASVDFAHLILSQHYSKSATSLIDPVRLKNAHVLELGAGTGFLSIALSPLVNHYTTTDIPALIPLILKNVSLNVPPSTSTLPTPPQITVDELDWIALQSSPPRQRAITYAYPPIDVLLVVDCIYHPSLLPPLVDTLDYLATPGRTAVVIVVELRAEDVVREFLTLWLGKAGWKIRRVVGSGLDQPYVTWVGWRE